MTTNNTHKTTNNNTHKTTTTIQITTIHTRYLSMCVCGRRVVRCQYCNKILRHALLHKGDVTNPIFCVTVLFLLNCKIMSAPSHLGTSAVQRHKFWHANENVRNIQRFGRGELYTFLCYWDKREDVKESGAPACSLLFLCFFLGGRRGRSCYWGKREDVKESGAPACLLLFLFLGGRSELKHSKELNRWVE